MALQVSSTPLPSPVPSSPLRFSSSDDGDLHFMPPQRLSYSSEDQIDQHSPAATIPSSTAKLFEQSEVSDDTLPAVAVVLPLKIIKRTPTRRIPQGAGKLQGSAAAQTARPVLASAAPAVATASTPISRTVVLAASPGTREYISKYGLLLDDDGTGTLV